MPQLDVTTFGSQLFWLGLCFIFLYLVLAKVLLPKIATLLQTRQANLTEHINKASLYREEAEDLLLEYESKLSLAKKETQEKTRDHIQAIHAKITLKKQQVLDKLATMQHTEEQKLYHAYIKAKGEVRPLAQEISHQILTKVLPSPSKDSKKRTLS